MAFPPVAIIISAARNHDPTPNHPTTGCDHRREVRPRRLLIAPGSVVPAAAVISRPAASGRRRPRGRSYHATADADGLGERDCRRPRGGAAGGGSTWIIALAILAMSCSECRAFAPSSRRYHHHHHRHRRRHQLRNPRSRSRISCWRRRLPRFAPSSPHDVAVVGCIARIAADDDDDGHSLGKIGFSPDWLSSAAPIVFAAAALFATHVEPVDALGGTPPFGIIRHERAAGSQAMPKSLIPPSPASNGMRNMQYPTFLSSEKSATGTVASLWAKSTANPVKENLFNNVPGEAYVAKKKLPKLNMSTTKKQIPSNKSRKIEGGELKVIDVKTIAEEGRIEVELIYKQRPLDLAVPIVKIDRETLQKVRVYQPPAFLRFLPSSVQPLVSGQFQSFKVLKSIPNEQLFVASVFAGSLTEIIRAVLLYPLSTIKSRVQARKRKSLINNRKQRSVQRKMRVSWLTFLHETKRGDLYAGLLPTLLISVPASGVYSGAKDVSKRVFSMAVEFHALQDLVASFASPYHIALAVNLLAAFVADIAALAIRTPADVLSLRLQVFGKTNVRSDFGNWAKDSVALLPAMIVTDTPLLLSRIFLNAAITTSGENLGRYEFETITIGEW